MARGGSENVNLESENTKSKSKKMEETIAEDASEASAMEKLVKSTIQKSRKDKWPKSINKGFKYVVNKIAQILSHPIMKKLVAEGARQGPPAFISPPNKNKQLIRLDPTSKLLFPPSTHSKYSPAIRIKVEPHNSKKNTHEIRDTASRRQKPLYEIPIKGFDERITKASGVQILKKDYHIPALLEAFNLPNNYFENLKDSQKVLKIVNLLRKHGQSENLLVEPNGRLNKREDVIHTFNPDSRLYVGFEKWQEFDDSFFITYYRMT